MLDELDNVFDDHPSLDASLEDFESNSNQHRSPTFGLPSQHSGFRSEESDPEPEDPTVERWSPPGFRGHDQVRGSGWYRHQPYQRRFDRDRFVLKPTMGLSAQQSREASPQYEDAREAPTSANVPLTGASSPRKTKSPSPSPVPQDGADTGGMDFGAENLSNCRVSWVALNGEVLTGKIYGLRFEQKSNSANLLLLSSDTYGPSLRRPPVPSPTPRSPSLSY